MRALSAIIITNTESTFTAKAGGPEAAQVNVRLWHPCVSNKKPEAKDRLGKNVEDSISNDLGVYGHLAGAVGNSPNTSICVNVLLKWFIDGSFELTLDRQSKQ